MSAIAIDAFGVFCNTITLLMSCLAAVGADGLFIFGTTLSFMVVAIAVVARG